MIHFPIETILPFCREKGFPLDETAVKRLTLYGSLLCEWNEKMNLTAITEPTDVVWKHFYDSLLLFTAVQPEKGAKVIDVGTGAGFPGMVLLIARPDLQLTLLDSLNKRLVFLSEVLKAIGLNACIVHARAEEGSRKTDLREQFDLSCARAVAPLNVLCEYCLPYVKVGGYFAALKGPAAEAEITGAKGAAHLLGGGSPNVTTGTLTGEEQRNIIVWKKVSHTSTKYPRTSAKIQKQPL